MRNDEQNARRHHGHGMTGIEMALWDIKGRALGQPLWNLLGDNMRDKVRIYAHAHEK